MVKHTSEEIVKDFARGEIKETNGTYCEPLNTFSILHLLRERELNYLQKGLELLGKSTTCFGSRISKILFSTSGELNRGYPKLC